MARKSFLFSLIVLYSVIARCQIFIDVTDSIGGFPLAPSRLYGAGISFFDVNEDGLDDLTPSVKSDTLRVWLSTGSNFIVIPLFYVEGEMKMALWGDYDNDGDNDLYIPVFQGSCKLYKNHGDWNFEDVSLSAGVPSFTNGWFFGASWCDYNQDGWLDLLQTSHFNYHSQFRNYLLSGSESGVFTDVSQTTGIHLGSAFSFQGSVCDLDFDGDQDIHIANDKFPIDALLINEGPWFSNEATSRGLDLASNSMSSSIADYDHDGEYEIFITNTPEFGNYILDNFGGAIYNTVVHPAALLPYTAWASLWIDVDNDSWEDVFIANEGQDPFNVPFFYNINGTLDLPNETTGLVGFNSFSASKGDYNGDGYYDIIVSSGEGLQPRLYQNNGGENNFLRIKIEGNTSNRSGVGAYIEYWVNNDKLITYTTSGNSYLAQDSQWMILGLGSANSIDSLSVSWLGGNTETYYNIQANQHIVIREGNPMDLYVLMDDFPNEEGVIQICNTDSTILTSSNNLPVQWSNGQISSSIIVNSSGIFSYSFVDPLNEIHYSNQVEVEVILDVIPAIEKNNPSCWYSTDGSIEVNIPSSWNVSWNNELFPDSLSMLNLGSGDFNLQFINDLNCSFDTSITLVSPDSLMWNMNILSPTCHGFDNGSIEITDVVGGTGVIHFWLDSIPTLQNLIEDLVEGTHTIVASDENNCISQSEVAIIAPDPLTAEVEVEEEEGQVEIEVSGGVVPYLLDLNDSIFTFWEELDYQNQWNHWSVSDANGCAVSDSFYIAPQVVIQTFESPSSTDQLIVRNNGVVSFNASAPLFLFIHDLSGRLVYSAALKPGITNLPRFHSGLYLATWRDAQAKRTKKFVIE